jgi:hypothetical protein
LTPSSQVTGGSVLPLLELLLLELLTAELLLELLVTELPELLATELLLAAPPWPELELAGPGPEPPLFADPLLLLAASTPPPPAPPKRIWPPTPPQATPTTPAENAPSTPKRTMVKGFIRRPLGAEGTRGATGVHGNVP